MKKTTKEMETSRRIIGRSFKGGVEIIIFMCSRGETWSPYYWLPDLWHPHRQTSIYFVWGILDREVNSRPYNTDEAVKAIIRDAMVNTDSNAVAKACASFYSHLEIVVTVDGGHIACFFLPYIFA